jgi:3-mercaptopyruvate sulfurtransferase SseA
LAEQGFYVKELNTGWAEWQEAGLPTHDHREHPAGELRCSCSLHPELLAGAAGTAAAH